MAGFSATVLTNVSLLIAVMAILGYVRLVRAPARELVARPVPPGRGQLHDQTAVVARRRDEPTSIIKRNQE